MIRTPVRHSLSLDWGSAMKTENSAPLDLRGLSPLEIREEVETVVQQMFREYLLMSEHEDLPQETSYFDLGLTSLRLSEIRERLETRLGLAINANVLFNEPTVERLVEHLTDALAG
ncbi:acyl carrier protein [Kitasatospora sp. NBC_01250]|uniref:acyl carrier protein n=1 Tax=unclassified Kitasatospora TaxID=2633591 RepID=UPI002E1065DA|nr:MULTISPECIES: acyl carrier protein [unclassified Kitasatospora]WSJ68212.1 acyl carrier protein [Kitasatospora sp. NBC_01302]